MPFPLDDTMDSSLLKHTNSQKTSPLLHPATLAFDLFLLDRVVISLRHLIPYRQRDPDKRSATASAGDSKRIRTMLQETKELKDARQSIEYLKGQVFYGDVRKRKYPDNQYFRVTNKVTMTPGSDLFVYSVIEVSPLRHLRSVFYPDFKETTARGQTNFLPTQKDPEQLKHFQMTQIKIIEKIIKLLSKQIKEANPFARFDHLTYKEIELCWDIASMNFDQHQIYETLKQEIVKLTDSFSSNDYNLTFASMQEASIKVYEKTPALTRLELGLKPEKLRRKGSKVPFFRDIIHQSNKSFEKTVLNLHKLTHLKSAVDKCLDAVKSCDMGEGVDIYRQPTVDEIVFLLSKVIPAKWAHELASQQLEKTSLDFDKSNKHVLTALKKAHCVVEVKDEAKRGKKGYKLKTYNEMVALLGSFEQSGIKKKRG